MENDEELARSLPDFMTKHGDQFDKHFLDDLDEQSMILKAHLLIESLMRDYCSSSVPNPEHLVGAKLNFHQVLSLTRALSPDRFKDLSDVQWAVAKHLNQLRNAMAHELEPDLQKIERGKRAIIDLVNRRSGKTGDDLDLRGCLGFILGSLGAYFQIILVLERRIEIEAKE